MGLQSGNERIQNRRDPEMDVNNGMLLRAMEGAFQAQRLDFCELQRKIADQIAHPEIQVVRALEGKIMETSRKVDKLLETVLKFDNDAVRRAATLREQIQAFGDKFDTAIRTSLTN